MLAGMFAAALGRPRLGLSGSLDATGSTSTITGTSRTITVPPSSSGSLSITGSGGTGSMSFNVNGAGFGTGPWTVSNGQSIQARATGLTGIGDYANATLTDGYSGKVLAVVTIQRTS